MILLDGLGVSEVGGIWAMDDCKMSMGSHCEKGIRKTYKMLRINFEKYQKRGKISYEMLCFNKMKNKKVIYSLEKWKTIEKIPPFTLVGCSPYCLCSSSKKRKTLSTFFSYFYRRMPELPSKFFLFSWECYSSPDSLYILWTI